VFSLVLTSNTLNIYEIEILTDVSMKDSMFWDVMPCSMVEFYVSEEHTVSVFRTGLARGNLYSEDRVKTIV
jgi:hypothetical protein